MPTKKLTDLFVERAKPPMHGRVEYFDASFPGLALRITATGGKSWCAFYRFHGRLRRFTIGAYPAIKPAQARREATAALERVREGFDPAEEKRTRRDRRSPETDTFAVVARDYLERHLRKNSSGSTYKEAKRDLEQNAITKWRYRPVASISRGDVIDLIDGIIARGAEIQNACPPARPVQLGDRERSRGRVTCRAYEATNQGTAARSRADRGRAALAMVGSR
jgi:hypothetical protein